MPAFLVGQYDLPNVMNKHIALYKTWRIHDLFSSYEFNCQSGIFRPSFKATV